MVIVKDTDRLKLEIYAKIIEKVINFEVGITNDRNVTVKATRKGKQQLLRNHMRKHLHNYGCKVKVYKSLARPILT